jgi:hypothetical protein
MLRWVRRRLNEIRYYSASREHTAWTRAADASLIFAFLVAFPITWVLNGQVERVDLLHAVTGVIQRTTDGALTVYVAREDAPASDFGIPAAELHGYFTMRVDEMDMGFPLVTSRLIRQPIVEVRRYPRVQAVAEVDLSPGAPMREAIEAALERTDTTAAREALALWRDGAARTETILTAWIGSSLIWCLLVFVALSMAITIARLFTVVFGRHRAAARAMAHAQGLCPHCRYDLRGLEFSERCPECGNLQQ